jgi:hypothetical protein
MRSNKDLEKERTELPVEKSITSPEHVPGQTNWTNVGSYSLSDLKQGP